MNDDDPTFPSTFWDLAAIKIPFSAAVSVISKVARPLFIDLRRSKREIRADDNEDDSGGEGNDEDEA